VRLPSRYAPVHRIGRDAPVYRPVVVVFCLFAGTAQAWSSELQEHVSEAADRARMEFHTRRPSEPAAQTLFTLAIESDNPTPEQVIRVWAQEDGRGLGADYARARTRQGFGVTYYGLARTQPSAFGRERAPGVLVEEWTAHAERCDGLEPAVQAVVEAAQTHSAQGFQRLSSGHPARLKQVVFHGLGYMFVSDGAVGGVELRIRDQWANVFEAVADTLRGRILACAGETPTRRYEVGALAPRD